MDDTSSGRSVAAAQAAIDTNIDLLRLEADHPPETQLFQLLVSLVEWCDHHELDFDLVMENVRQHFIRCPGRDRTVVHAEH